MLIQTSFPILHINSNRAILDLITDFIAETLRITDPELMEDLEEQRFLAGWEEFHDEEELKGNLMAGIYRKITGIKVE